MRKENSSNCPGQSLSGMGGESLEVRARGCIPGSAANDIILPPSPRITLCLCTTAQTCMQGSLLIHEPMQRVRFETCDNNLKCNYIADMSHRTKGKKAGPGSQSIDLSYDDRENRSFSGYDAAARKEEKRNLSFSLRSFP